MKLRHFLSGLLIGCGATLIIDKIWWKYFASKRDFPDHYLLGLILIIIGLLTLNRINIIIQQIRKYF